MRPSQPYLLDVTRLISRSWTRRRATGIDRVSYAYLDHFAENSLATLQYRGNFLVLKRRDTASLYKMLLGPDDAFRRSLAIFAPQAFARSKRKVDGSGSVYINVSHTDFDLDRHWQWARDNKLHTVYLIHDLIPINHAEHCLPHAVERHRGRVVKALKTAGGIIANSRATAADLADFAARHSDRLPPVLVAPLAGAHLLSSGARVKCKRPYFLVVGTIEPRKNHQLLLRVWQGLARDAGLQPGDVPHLVCIGQWGANSERVRAILDADPLLRRNVSVLDDCSDAELADWIAGAHALLMPSLAEGFGLPVVEALGLGTPVVASDLPCFREVGQSLSVLLDPTACNEWARIVRQLTSDNELRTRLQVRTREFQRPTWKDHFGLVDAWLEDTAVRHRERKTSPTNAPKATTLRDSLAEPAVVASGDGKAY